MANTDLKARPIHHSKQGAIYAHLTIVMTAMRVIQPLGFCRVDFPASIPPNIAKAFARFKHNESMTKQNTNALDA